MKKLILSTAVCCMSLFMYAQKAETAADPHAGHNHGATASAKPATANAVEGLSVKQEIFDFGKIPQGKPVTTVFEVFNTTNQPLKIANVQASCGCTTPEWDRNEDVPAGGSTKITVGYNAAAEGPFMKPITITYGDSQTKILNIKGEVAKAPATSAPENSAASEIKN